jgi:hypothetical protein
MADFKPCKGISANTAFTCGASTVIWVLPQPGDTAISLPPSPVIGSAVVIQNDSQSTSALVFGAPQDNVRINGLAPGLSLAVAPNASRTFTAVSGSPYAGTG